MLEFLKRKKIQNKKPRVLFVETCNTCNRSCPFCYWGHFPKPKRELIDPILFNRILTDVRAVTPTLETINLYLINEPFLDPFLKQRVLECKEVFGKSQLVRIVTNSSLITVENCQGLLNLPKVRIYANAYDTSNYEKIKGIQVLLKPHRTSKFEVWDVRNQTTWDTQLILQNYDCSPYHINTPMIEGVCLRPDRAIVIRWDGTMVLCCTDVASKTAYFHFSPQVEDNLVDVWRKLTTQMGQHLKNGIRENFCQDCSRIDLGYW